MWTKLSKNHLVLIKIETITEKQGIYSPKLSHHVVTTIHVTDSNLPAILWSCVFIWGLMLQACVHVFTVPLLISQKPAAVLMAGAADLMRQSHVGLFNFTHCE